MSNSAYFFEMSWIPLHIVHQAASSSGSVGERKPNGWPTRRRRTRWCPVAMDQL